jgi:hypothetical protein
VPGYHPGGRSRLLVVMGQSYARESDWSSTARAAHGAS